MEQKDRDAIQKNFSSLVEQTDLDTMVQALFEKGVFSERMIEPYTDSSKEPRARKRLLYREIERRGPDAFKHLLDALQENGYWDLVRDLDPSSGLHKRPSTNLNPSRNNYISISESKRMGPKEQEYQKNPASKVEPSLPQQPIAGPAPAPAAPAPSEKRKPLNDEPVLNVIKSTHFFEENETDDIKLYRTRRRARGVLLMFSYVSFRAGIERTRDGADVDDVRMRYLFTEMGFIVRSYLNASYEETVNALRDLKNTDVASPPDTVFVMFSSHGYYKDRTGDNDIRCSDGKLISLYEIISYFSNEAFPALIGVPKVFIFQNCRGSGQPHKSLPAPASADSAGGGDAADAAGLPPAHHAQPPYSDILIAHSTVPGYVSLRDPSEGSWYIQALCLVFSRRAHDTHVAKLFKLVDLQLQRDFKSQTSSIDHWGFNRNLYLHPGLCEDKDGNMVAL